MLDNVGSSIRTYLYYPARLIAPLVQWWHCLGWESYFLLTGGGPWRWLDQYHQVELLCDGINYTPYQATALYLTLYLVRQYSETQTDRQ